jgi:hypothetical protein
MMMRETTSKKGLQLELLVEMMKQRQSLRDPHNSSSSHGNTERPVIEIDFSEYLN